MGFQKVATREDLWSGEMMGLEVNGNRILLVNLDDHLYAYSDACPHQNSRLSEGTLTGAILRCARHQWEFDVCSGSGVNPRNACMRQVENASVTAWKPAGRQDPRNGRRGA